MKTLFLFIVTITSMLNSITMKADTLDTLLVKHLVYSEGITYDEATDYFFYVELNRVDYQVDSLGIYSFGVTSSNSNSYVLLLSKDVFKILDFKDDIETDLIKLCTFLKNHKSQFTFNQRKIYLQKIMNIISLNSKNRSKLIISE